MAYQIEPAITVGDYLVIEDSDPRVANIVFDGTYEECAEWVRNHKEGN